MKASTSDPKYRGALGGVFKDEDFDRLINSCMPENCRETKVFFLTKLLGSGAAFCDLYIGVGEVAAISTDDLIDFYNKFIISDSHALRNHLKESGKLAISKASPVQGMIGATRW